MKAKVPFNFIQFLFHRSYINAHTLYVHYYCFTTYCRLIYYTLLLHTYIISKIGIFIFGNLNCFLSSKIWTNFITGNCYGEIFLQLLFGTLNIFFFIRFVQMYTCGICTTGFLERCLIFSLFKIVKNLLYNYLKIAAL